MQDRIQESQLDSVSILLIFLMVSIMCIFCISLLVIMVRKSIDIKRLKRFEFILIMVGYLISKAIICSWLLIRILFGISNNWENLSPEEIQILFKNSLITAEICMVQLFLVSFQFYIAKYIAIIPRLSSVPPKLKKVFYIIEGSYLLASTILLMLFNINNIVAYQLINLYSLIINTILILSFLVAFFYISFLMTGIMLSEETRDGLNRLYKYVLLLLFSRFTVLAFQFVVEIQIKDGSFQGFINLIQNNRNRQIIQCLIFIGYIIYILLSQGLPLMYSLRRVIIKVFTVLKSTFDDYSIQEDLRSPLNRGSLYKSVKENTLQSTYTEALQEINSLSDFSGIQSIQTINSQIWRYYRGQYKSRLFFIKKSKFAVSNYLIEDAAKEISLIRSKNILELNQIGYFQNNQTIFLYEPFRHKNFVDEAIKQGKLKKKINIALLFAQSIKRMHDNNFIHGCLSTNNIFLVIDGLTEAPRYRIKFSGYGLQSLKRYFALTTDYTNKTIYTAPQYLINRNSVILKPKKQADIYSFGMILYELITMNFTYRNLGLRQLQKTMGQGDFRPKMPQDVHSGIKKIIRLCWNKQAHERPKIQQIIHILKQLDTSMINY